MGNLTGLLFSVLVITPMLLLGVDLYAVSALKTHLETRATTLSYQISKEGGVRNTLVNKLEEEKITINCFGTCELVSSGQILKYEISTFYTPLVLSNEQLTISVIRTVMVGYL